MKNQTVVANLNLNTKDACMIFTKIIRRSVTSMAIKIDKDVLDELHLSEGDAVQILILTSNNRQTR